MHHDGLNQTSYFYHLLPFHMIEFSPHNAMFNAPIKSNRTQWLMTKLEYGSADVVLPNGYEIEGDSELKAEIGVKWFF
jgi:hypothetical protein